jgi:hypothetical protein
MRQLLVRVLGRDCGGGQCDLRCVDLEQLARLARCCGAVGTDARAAAQ